MAADPAPILRAALRAVLGRARVGRPTRLGIRQLHAALTADQPESASVMPLYGITFVVQVRMNAVMLALLPPMRGESPTAFVVAQDHLYLLLCATHSDLPEVIRHLDERLR